VTGELDRAQPTPPKELRLLLGLALGPLAFLLDLEASYAMVGRVCRSGARAWLFLPSVVSLGMITAAVWLSRARARAAGAEPAGRSADRARFLATCGLALDGIFFGLIVAMAIAKAVFDPCDR
jgi:hypothetical protein